MSIGKKASTQIPSGDPVRFLYGTRKWPGKSWKTEAPWGTMDVASTEFASTRDRKTSRHSRFPKKLSKAVIKMRTPFKLLGCVRNSVSPIFGGRRRTSGRQRQSAVSCIQGVKAKGAVGYTTGRWEGEREGDENHAIVTVLVECDQTMCDSHSRVRPTAWPVMTATARELADRMFKTRHQDALIEHEGIES